MHTTAHANLYLLFGSVKTFQVVQFVVVYMKNRSCPMSCFYSRLQYNWWTDVFNICKYCCVCTQLSSCHSPDCVLSPKVSNRCPVSGCVFAIPGPWNTMPCHAPTKAYLSKAKFGSLVIKLHLSAFGQFRLFKTFHIYNILQSPQAKSLILEFIKLNCVDWY